MAAAVSPLHPRDKPANLFDLYFEYMAAKEPPQIFNRWCFIGVLGAWMGRRYWLPFGEFRIFPNNYIQLIGEAGARKSTAIKQAKKVLSTAGYNTYAADRTRQEKFLMDLEGLDSDEVDANEVMANILGDAEIKGDPREVFVVADEFNEFIGRGNIDFMSLLGTLWDWDDEVNPFTHRLKNSKSVSIWQPTISILGGNTHEGFADAFPPQALGQGFLSRMILIYSDPSPRKQTIPTSAPPEVRDKLIKQMHLMREKVNGPATVTDKAMSMLDVIYRSELLPVDDVRFKGYNNRRFTHLLKLCLICSAVELRTEVTANDVVLANTILAFAEHYMPLALGEFGRNKNNDVANKILGILAEATEIVPQQKLWKETSTDLGKPADLIDILSNLRQANKIGFTDRPIPGFYLIKKTIKQNRMYVDFNLLRERQP